MSKAYSISNPEGIYFVTFATVEWADVFTRRRYHEIVLDSLRYCIAHKGLALHPWCLMSNHLHLIISRNGTSTLSDILRDFKKFTAAQLWKAIQEGPESRRNWLLWLFKQAGARNSKNTNFQFWQQDNHAEELLTNPFTEQKLNYLHRNPVEAGLVDEPEHYLLSSARDYAGVKGLLPVVLME